MKEGMGHVLLNSFVVFSFVKYTISRLHTFSMNPARPSSVAPTPSFTNKISVGSVTPTEFKHNKIFIKKFPIQRQSSKFDSDCAKSLVAFSI